VSALLGTAPVLLAHQNGWDEFLLVAGPMVVIAGLLWLAKRRVDAAHAARPADPVDGDVADGDAADGDAITGGATDAPSADRPDEPSHR
jgi:hypothetical protein